GRMLRPAEPPATTTAESNRAHVAQSWGVSVDALVSKRRTKESTVPRQVAMYVIQELIDMPLVEIVKLFGGREHSTVIHSLNKVEAEMAGDEEFRRRVEQLRSELRG